MYQQTQRYPDTAPKENDVRFHFHYAWWPTRFLLSSEGEERVVWVWLEHYEVMERFRKLYCWAAANRSFFEWHEFKWCLESVRMLTKTEYNERTGN